MTMVEKILARASGQTKVRANDYVTARIDAAMAQDFFRLIPGILKKGGIPEEGFRIWDKERFIVVLDHNVPTSTLLAAKNYKQARAFASKLGVKYFYDVFPGISHQIMHEKGHVLPGALIVGTDSHTTTYGALNAASCGIGASEMAYVIQTGELWFAVPETIRFDVMGKLPPRLSSKDVLLYVAGKYGTEVAQYRAIEWTGPAVDAMSLDARLAVANMSVEIGAKFGLFRADEKTLSYLSSRTAGPLSPVEPDPDAVYAASYAIDASSLAPQVALPHNVGNVKPVTDVKGTPIDQAIIASCANGRIEDLECAAAMVKGKKIAKGVRFYGDVFSFLQALCAGREISRDIKMNGFVADPGRGVKGGLVFEAPCRIPNLLLKFPRDGLVGRLAGIQLSCGQFEYEFPDRVTELPDQENAAVVENRDGGDPSGMQHYFPDRCFSRSLPDRIHMQRHNFAAIYLLMFDNRRFYIAE